MNIQPSSDFIQGIQHSIDVITSSLDNPAINMLPPKMTLQVLIASLKSDVADFNVGG